MTLELLSPMQRHDPVAAQARQPKITWRHCYFSGSSWPGRVRLTDPAIIIWGIGVGGHGPGIPERFHSRIFTTFRTLQSRDIDIGRLGPAIVRKLIQSNGGQILLESTPPTRDSTFVVTWKTSENVRD